MIIRNLSLEIHSKDMSEYFELVDPGVVRIKGHRVGIEHIVERYHQGYSPEQIMLDFPGMSLEKIYGVIAYYLGHKEEVDDYLVQLDALVRERMNEYDRQNPVPITEYLKARRAQQQQQGITLL